MSTSNNKTADGCLGLFLGSLLCFGIIAQIDSMPWNVQSKHVPYEPPKTESNYTSNIDSGQRARKIIKSIKVIPTTETYEVSQWITSGDWSQDDYPLTITIPSQKVVMDLDYVEDHWDDFISDPEDEILYPPEIFQ